MKPYLGFFFFSQKCHFGVEAEAAISAEEVVDLEVDVVVVEVAAVEAEEIDTEGKLNQNE